MELCTETIKEFQLPISISQKDITVLGDYIGAGYGVPDEMGLAAIRTFARREGIILDPTYTGKAAAALLDMIDQSKLSEPILFWHTGGTPGIFTHSSARHLSLEFSKS